MSEYEAMPAAWSFAALSQVGIAEDRRSCAVSGKPYQTGPNDHGAMRSVALADPAGERPAVLPRGDVVGPSGQASCVR
ncbi:hypothetical protein SUDANB178_07506 [Streptomyces sp. enrichment culture]